MVWNYIISKASKYYLLDPRKLNKNQPKLDPIYKYVNCLHI